jgi:anti-sigma factor RsiW
MMDHQSAVELLPAYVDDELDPAAALALERHLADCATCRREYAQQRTMHKLVRSRIEKAVSPAALAQRIAAALPAEKRPRAPWRSPAAGFAFGFALSALVLLMPAGVYRAAWLPDGSPLTQQIAYSHIRSMQADHLIDIASSDRHVVKPWFNGKLDFSPPVIDMAEQGFSLEGGRLDFIDGHPAAVLVYRHNRHPINVYAWPGAARATGVQMHTSRGYHLAQWTAGGMRFWAASDLAMDELHAFAAQLRALAAEQAQSSSPAANPPS